MVLEQGGEIQEADQAKSGVGSCPQRRVASIDAGRDSRGGKNNRENQPRISKEVSRDGAGSEEKGQKQRGC